MKIASFNDYRVGVVSADGIKDVTAVLPDFLSQMPAQRINWLIEHWKELKDPVLNARGASIPVSSLRLLLRKWNTAPTRIWLFERQREN